MEGQYFLWRRVGYFVMEGGAGMFSSGKEGGGRTGGGQVFCFWKGGRRIF